MVNIFFDNDRFQKKLAVMPSKKLMALDMGEKKIGIAMSNENLTISFPYEVYQRKNINKDLGRLCAIIIENQICGVIIGLDQFNMQHHKINDQIDNLSNMHNKKFLHNIINFAHKLYKNLLFHKKDLPFLFYDESCTTFYANHILQFMNVNLKASMKIDDKIAASLILEDFIQNNNNRTCNY